VRPTVTSQEHMRTFILAIILSIIVLLQPSIPVAVYVAPYGVSTAAGAADSPKTLAWAMQSAPSGSTVWLIPGTYKGDYRALAPGVTYRSLPGTRAKIDGSLRVSASYVTVQGLEITNTNWTNRVASNGSAFEVITPGFSVPITGVQVLGNYMHDLAGVNDWSTSHASVWENNLVYNIGWTGHGHALYTQNESGAEKRFERNIFSNSYGFATQAYGSSAASIDDFTFENNVFLNGRFLLGGGRAVHNAHILDNRFYKSILQVGYANHFNQDVTVEGNWIGNARLQMQWVYTPTVMLNRIVPTATDNAVYVVPPIGGGFWNANTYYKPGTGSTFGIDQQGFYSLAGWRAATGWDSTSTVTATLPLENWIEVTASGANQGRVVVYNWQGLANIDVDLSPLSLTPGASYRLINAQNPGESLPFIAGSPVSLSTSGWTVAPPYGATSPLYSWSSQFLVFLVEP
jgi:hypothetical protein